MAKKTFKIGESCKGGIITVETKGNIVDVIAKDWDFSQGSKKGSNQSNAKEFDRVTVNLIRDDADRDMLRFLQDLTSSYYACMVMKWIEEKTELKRSILW